MFIDYNYENKYEINNDSMTYRFGPFAFNQISLKLNWSIKKQNFFY